MPSKIKFRTLCKAFLIVSYNLVLIPILSFRDKCLAAGMSDYITKPVECRRLFETIAKWTMDEANAARVSSTEL